MISHAPADTPLVKSPAVLNTIADAMTSKTPVECEDFIVKPVYLFNARYLVIA